ncbi:hypothetical protein MUK42_37568 [Musa troglodytarum]|uniref:Uncharacterized protein n=1 Tax=Musa troglodytarum TaxID=320322 RepID=A0A9E7JAY0_9LILI|nr:hypothetical protein MUK42_37568 [Musa troglodytarum]
MIRDWVEGNGRDTVKRNVSHVFVVGERIAGLVAPCEKSRHEADFCEDNLAAQQGNSARSFLLRDKASGTLGFILTAWM